MPKQTKVEPKTHNPNAIRVEIELPLPPKQLSANVAAHWGNKTKPRNNYRALCANHFRMAMRSGDLPKMKAPITVHLEYFLYRPTKKKDGPLRAALGKKWLYPQDEDNARYGAKAAQDSLQDAGFILRDSSKTLRTGEVLIRSRAGKVEKGGHGFKSCLLFILEGEPLECDE